MWHSATNARDKRCISVRVWIILRFAVLLSLRFRAKLAQTDRKKSPEQSGLFFLCEGGYLSRSEPVIFLGETGTGKTHMATGLAIAACQQRKRVRFTTAAQLVNQLTEAKNKSELNRVTNRWMRYELIVIDEMA